MLSNPRKTGLIVVPLIFAATLVDNTAVAISLAVIALSISVVAFAVTMRARRTSR